MDRPEHQRAATAAHWAFTNPILDLEEWGLDATEGRWKRGDGTTRWSDLPWAPLTLGGPALGSAAYADITQFATAEEGDLAVMLYERGDWRAAGFVTLDSANRLPAADGSQLIALPPPLAVLSQTQVEVASTAEVTVFSATLPADALRTDGQYLTVRTEGEYLNAAEAAGLRLRIKLGGVVVYDDTIASIPADAAPRLVAIRVDFTRFGATAGRLSGQIHVGAPEGVAAGMGELGAIARASNAIAAPRPSQPALTVDWAAAQPVAISIQKSAGSGTYTHCHAWIYSDRPALAVAIDPPVVPVTTVDALEDVPAIEPATRTFAGPFATRTAFPVHSLGSVLQWPNAEVMSCYDLVCGKVGSDADVAAAQDINPELAAARVACPQEYQGWLDPAGRTGNGMPFDADGPATTGTGPVYAGHFLYYPNSVTTSALTATGTTVTVADISKFKVNEFVCVSNVPRGQFIGAEHCQIIGITGSQLTLARAQRSTGKPHAAGSIIAMHVRGNGAVDEYWNWTYNLSSACPLDSLGQQFSHAWALSCAQWFDKTAVGGATQKTVSLVLFDSDFGFLGDGGAKTDQAADCNNDGQPDTGIDLATGVNLWGVGLNDTFQRLRAALDAAGHTEVMVVGGDTRTAGMSHGCGMQAEAIYDRQSSNGTAVTDYATVSEEINLVMARRAYSSFRPVIIDHHGKVATLSYNPGNLNPPPTSDAPARLHFNAALLCDGSFAPKNWAPVSNDRYYVWQSVITTPGDPNYGQSIAKTDYAGRRTHGKYLGAATTEPRRIYDPAQFADALNLIPTSGFETDAEGWVGTGCSVARSTVRAYAGTASLLITPTLPLPDPYLESITARGPSIALTGGRVYTVAFAAWSATTRNISPRLNGAIYSRQGFTVWGNRWQKYVWIIRVPSSGTYRLQFDVGQTGAPVWIDQLRCWEGNAGVWRRDFASGICVVNLSPEQVTVGLGGPFLRIAGPYEPVWDGVPITTVTLPAYDAVTLLRPDA